jgi:hypothetical protein
VSASAARLRPLDLVAILALGALGACLAWQASGVIGPRIVDWRAFDLWFQSDAPRVYENLVVRTSDHARSNVHPLFSLVGYGTVYLIRRLFQVPPWTAVRCFEALGAALWSATLYLLLRVAGHRPRDGAVLTLLGLGSAAALLWLGVPESYTLGSLTLMLPLLVLVASAGRRVPLGLWVLASAASLSITVTNWMSGLAAAWRALGWRRAALVSGAALVLVVAGWVVQHRLIPSTRFFVGAEEQSYLRRPTPRRIARVVTTVAAHSVVLPRLERTIPAPNWLSAQRAWPGSGGPLATLATVAWVVLLALGLREAWHRRGAEPLVTVTLACLAGQLALHLVYGEESMLYALHWLPLLVLVAGLALQGPARSAAFPLALLATAGAWASNLPRLRPVAGMIASDRQAVLAEMRRRPGDPWPRGESHVVLAAPGTEADAKAYLEPGGSFSPRARSFGIALWVRDSSGRLRTTSDAIPLTRLRQRFDSGATVPPAVVVRSPWYAARWTYDGRWRLQVRPERGARIELVLRSVGPAGGPVERLQWHSGRLRVNDRWLIEPSPAPATMVLGDERSPGWQQAGTPRAQWRDDAGWGYARFPLPAETTSVLTITDAVLPAAPPARLEPLPRLRLPDPAFEASLRAQVAHLLMATVHEQTRSADPLNTAVPWQRTGAYEIVALVRAGQAQRSRALAELMIRRDYYGGFGAEADAPGLGIWALTEVAAALRDSSYDRRVWPAVDRKAALIERYLTARDTIRATVLNRIVPRYRLREDNDVVALPSRDGLVVGRMDHHYPLLYVNAVSYLGLREAAGLADRVGEVRRAADLRARAGALRRAWLRAFEGRELANERTYISALWPSGVADTADGPARLLGALADRRASLWDSAGGRREPPLWTYFDLAEAHQWLRLGRPDETWSVLRWYWDHQESPGLYTWSEDSTEGNSFGDWDRVRGWVHPAEVTPHYWTSAEMLLLQLDMLATAEPSGGGTTLVIGAGVPRAWLAGPLGVRGLQVLGRSIDWTWDGHRVRVGVQGAPLDLRLGPAFPPGTPTELVPGGL